MLFTPTTPDEWIIRRGHLGAVALMVGSVPRTMIFKLCQFD